jgi:acetyl esterase/lipase
MAATESTRAANPPRLVLGAVLLVVAIALLGASSLVFFVAPTAWLWIVAILAAEWGHYGAVICLLLIVVALRTHARFRIAVAIISACAAMFFLVPLGRAVAIGRTLPQICTAAFGDSGAQRDGGRKVPLSVLDLFRDVSRGAVDVTEHVYAQNGSKQLKLDLYRARNRSAPAPLILVIHGGSWNGGSKQQLPAINRYLASEGFVVASINYRHAPKSPFPAAVDDIFRALDFLKGRAAEFGIDPARAVLIGRSAGGQLAVSAAYAGRDPSIRGVVSFYGPTDLVLGYEKPSAPGVLDSRRVLRDYLAGTPAEKPDAYAAASPLNFVGPATPPTLLIHGALDGMVWVKHSELLTARLDFAERPHLFLRLPWATHGCEANLSGPSGQLSLYAIDRFLAAVVGAQ